MPKEQAVNGRIGALESWARTEDRTARTAPGRSKFMERFDEFPDPEAARRAYFARLAAKSAATRRRKKAALVGRATPTLQSSIEGAVAEFLVVRLREVYTDGKITETEYDTVLDVFIKMGVANRDA